jgi:hypothetical protein
LPAIRRDGVIITHKCDENNQWHGHVGLFQLRILPAGQDVTGVVAIAWRSGQTAGEYIFFVSPIYIQVYRVCM